MERKPLTHDEHLDIISKSMALANSIFMHHNTFIGKNYYNFGGIK